MPSDSHKHSKDQQELIEAMNANQRAIDTQKTCGLSFNELIQRIKTQMGES